jgi:Domain of unknown function (DUF4386)
VKHMRKTSIVAGVMLIVATLTGVLSLVVFGSLLDGSDFLTRVAGHPDQVAAGAVLEAVMGLACAGVAISLYPVLREFNSGLAIGAVGFRVAEGVIWLVAAVALLALVTLGGDAAAAGTLDAAWARSSADLLRAINYQCSVVVMLPFAVGALLYYYAFWKTRVVPRWLSGWGLIAISLTLAVVFVAMLSRTDLNSYSALMMPLAVQEMVLAVWLIARGFRRPALGTAPTLGPVVVGEAGA